MKAIGHVFPNSPTRFCLRHIYANFQRAGFKGEDLKKDMFAASYSFTKSGFDKAMASLKKDCELAYKWLMQIPIETWCRHAFDTNCKTDLVVNNLSEVFNKMILDVRNKPIQTMIDGIKDKLMVKYSQTRAKAEVTRWEITPFYSEKLEEAKKHSRECKAKNAEIGLWQVATKGTDVVGLPFGSPTMVVPGSRQGRSSEAQQGYREAQGLSYVGFDFPYLVRCDLHRPPETRPVI